MIAASEPPDLGICPRTRLNVPVAKPLLDTWRKLPDVGTVQQFVNMVGIYDAYVAQPPRLVRGNSTLVGSGVLGGAMSYKNNADAGEKTGVKVINHLGQIIVRQDREVPKVASRRLTPMFIGKPSPASPERGT